MKHIDYGLGIFQKAAFHHYPEDAIFDLAQVQQELLQRDQLAAYEVLQRFYEIGSARGLEETREHLAAKNRRTQVNP